MKSRPRHIPGLAALVTAAWTENAPAALFAGMTLAEFQTAIQPSTDTRGQLVSLATQRRAQQDERDAADNATRDAIQRVVGAIRSDPAHGPDSPLLTAMGYATRSSRKSGLTRKVPVTVNTVPLAKAA